MRVLAAAALVLGALAWAGGPAVPSVVGLPKALELAQAACEKRLEACPERDRLEALAKAEKDAARAARHERLRLEIVAMKDAGR